MELHRYLLHACTAYAVSVWCSAMLAYVRTHVRSCAFMPARRFGAQNRWRRCHRALSPTTATGCSRRVARDARCSSSASRAAASHERTANGGRQPAIGNQRSANGQQRSANSARAWRRSFLASQHEEALRATLLRRLERLRTAASSNRQHRPTRRRARQRATPSDGLGAEHAHATATAFRRRSSARAARGLCLPAPAQERMRRAQSSASPTPKHTPGPTIAAAQTPRIRPLPQRSRRPQADLGQMH
jgi:hypothetical protein